MLFCSALESAEQIPFCRKEKPSPEPDEKKAAEPHHNLIASILEEPLAPAYSKRDNCIPGIINSEFKQDYSSIRTPSP